MQHWDLNFFVFDETPHSVREKGYRNMTPIAPGTFGYSMIRLAGRKSIRGNLEYC